MGLISKLEVPAARPHRGRDFSNQHGSGGRVTAYLGRTSSFLRDVEGITILARAGEGEERKFVLHAILGHSVLVTPLASRQTVRGVMRTAALQGGSAGQSLPTREFTRPVPLTK